MADAIYEARPPRQLAKADLSGLLIVAKAGKAL